MRRGLQITLYIVSLIPLATGIAGLILGPGQLMAPGDPISPSLDSQYRFLSVYYISLSLTIWYIVPTIEKHTTLFRIVILVLFAGGLARLYSYFYVGPPMANFTGGMIFELCLPVFILWHNKVVALSKPE